MNASLFEPDADPPPSEELAAHLRARRPRALRVFLAFTTAGLVTAALLPPYYRATAILAVLPAPEFTVRADAGSTGFSNAALALDQIMKAETEILQSDTLHAATLQSIGTATIYPALQPDPREGWAHRAARLTLHLLLSPWRAEPANPQAARAERALRAFAGDLRVLPTKDSNIIELRYTHRDGSLAARVLNTMLAHYAAQRGHIYDDPQLKVIRAESETLAAAAKSADTAFAAYKLAHAITDSPAERALLLHRQSDTNQALADAQSDHAVQAATRAELDRQITAAPRAVNLYTEHDPDTRLQSIDASLVTLRATLAETRVHYLDSSRKVQDLQNQLRVRTAERAERAEPAKPSIIRNGRSTEMDSLLLDRARAAAAEQAAAARTTALRGQAATIAATLADITRTETTLADLTRRKDAADTNFATINRVLAEQRLTEAEDALRMANVRVIQPAVAPQRQTMLPVLVAAAGFLLGLFAGAVTLLWSYAIRPTFLTQAGLAHATGLPVLGVIQARRREAAL